MRSPTATERALARRVDELKLTRDVFPIADPHLAQVSELLHRICVAMTLETAQWMAGDAIIQLRAYATNHNQGISNGSH